MCIPHVREIGTPALDAEGLCRMMRDCDVPDMVTTTSPAVAFAAGRNFANAELRASVNMRVGTIQAMEHLADLFDSYYVQRDFQRNLSYLARLRTWAGAKSPPRASNRWHVAG